MKEKRNYSFITARGGMQKDITHEDNLRKKPVEKCDCGHSKKDHFFGYEEHCKIIECKCERFDIGMKQSDAIKCKCKPPKGWHLAPHAINCPLIHDANSNTNFITNTHSVDRKSA